MTIKDDIFKREGTGKLLLKFAIPSVFALFVSELYNMVDTVYVGQFLNTNALAALTIAYPIQRLLSALSLLVSIGSSTYVARCFGKKDYNGMKKIIETSLCFVLVLISLSCLFLYIFLDKVLYALGASSSVYPLARTYVSIILIGSIFQGLTLTACNIMIALGKTRVSLYNNIIGAVLNIILNYIFIAILKFNIEGAAISTVLSQITACIYTFYNFKDVKKLFNIKFSLLSLKNMDVIFKIAVIGFSTFAIEISDAVVAIVLNNVLAARGGDTAIVMLGVITKVSMFLFITIIGISSATQPIIAYNFGAKRYDKIRECLSIAAKSLIFVTFLCWLIFITMSSNIMGIFIKDKLILKNTVAAFRICILLNPLLGIYYVMIYFYQSMGKAKKSFILSIYRETILFIPLALILQNIIGIRGVWIAYPITDIITILTSFILFKRSLRNIENINLKRTVLMQAENC